MFEYDSDYRLIRSARNASASSIDSLVNNAVTNADTASISGDDDTWQLDGVSNWTQRTDDGTSVDYTVNEMNEYTAVDGVTQLYDDNGNLLEDGQRSYAYDGLNRLVSITENSTETARYHYDGLNRRAAKVVQGSLSRFFYDRWQMIEERDGNDATSQQFVYGRGIDEVLQLRTNSQDYYYHDNVQGSIAALTDSSGTVIERYRYDAYGQTSIFNASNQPLSQSQVNNPYRYTGRRFDIESGLYYYRLRYYDPLRGRFLQRDPMGYLDGMNLYAYVGNNPLNLIDPYGLWSAQEAWNDLKFYVPDYQFFEDFSRGTRAEMYDFFIKDTVEAIREGNYTDAALSALMAIAKPLKAVNMMKKSYKKLTKADKARLKRENKNKRKCKNNKKGKGKNSFVAGTLIVLDGELADIETVDIGDSVWAYDTETAEPQLASVSETFQRLADGVMVIRIGEETIEVTPEHPFWVVGKGWVEAGYLQAGDLLLALDGSSPEIDAVTAMAKAVQVYNFEVAGLHNYFASSLSVLTHNEDIVSIYKAPQLGKGERQFEDGYHPDDFSEGDECVYFAKEKELADEYSQHYGEGVIELQIPEGEYNARLKRYEYPYQGGPYTELQIPHSAFDVLNRAGRLWWP